MYSYNANHNVCSLLLLLRPLLLFYCYVLPSPHSSQWDGRCHTLRGAQQHCIIYIYNILIINNQLIVIRLIFWYFLFIDFSCFVRHWTWKNRSKIWLKIKSLAKDVFWYSRVFYKMSIHWQYHLLKGNNQRWFLGKWQRMFFDIVCSKSLLNSYNNTVGFLNWSPLSWFLARTSLAALVASSTAMHAGNPSAEAAISSISGLWHMSPTLKPGSPDFWGHKILGVLF